MAFKERKLTKSNKAMIKLDGATHLDNDSISEYKAQKNMNVSPESLYNHAADSVVDYEKRKDFSWVLIVVLFAAVAFVIGIWLLAI